MRKKIPKPGQAHSSEVEVKEARQRPVSLRFADGSQVQFKLDAVFLAHGICAVGGWFSEPATFSLEADGEEITPQRQTSVSRPDVNAFLQTPETQRHGFACIAECAPSKTLFLLAELRQRNAVVRIALDMTTAEAEETETYPAVFGAEALRKLRNLLHRRENARPRMRAALDYAYSYQDTQGESLCVLSGWVILPDDATLEVETEDERQIPVSRICFWPREDIEKLYGGISGRKQRGCGVTITLDEFVPDGEELVLTGCWKGERQRLCRVEVSQESAFHNFIKQIFGIPYPWTELANVFESQFLKPFGRLQASRMKALAEVPFEEGQLGTPPAAPKASIIIPLYGTLDFLTTQIMCFSEDSAFKNQAELIYVLDDPTLVDGFRIMLEERFQLFRVPVRWVFGFCNRGFAAANNLGACIARGNTLIFMNSDVFPRQPGWINQFVSYLDASPDTGIAGCRLLYPDGSLQHAGMRFLYREALRIWTNVHPFSGCAPGLDPATGPTSVPAVTGACMALRREDYDAVGGWSTDYIIGDFEDSDLCLKMREYGKRIDYLPDISLVHLERQTFSLLGDDSYRQRLAIYNAVAHQQKWQVRLAEASTAQASQTKGF
ncbi:glycosyltransferase family 2 protein [uncultured Desulfovibrio sp.]|uniref:glycosyltransferase family 2 protein n=1 Tax=uncultured Desulfovibrio sp. TaxID=167968 RepID=UPI002617B00C|nr:glycosyltransferase family 2 protein [uncultured Desulfovibrio sp.]